MLFRRGPLLKAKTRSAEYDIMTRSNRDDGEDEQNGPDERRGTHIDISLSVTDILSELLDGRESGSDRRTPARRPRGRPTRAGPDSSSSRDESSERESTDGEEFHVDSYRGDDSLTVVADLPGTTRDDLTTGIDAERNELVVAVGDTVAGRVSLPWDPVEVDDTTFNNGVLQIRLRPAAGD